MDEREEREEEIRKFLAIRQSIKDRIYQSEHPGGVAVSSQLDMDSDKIDELFNELNKLFELGHKDMSIIQKVKQILELVRDEAIPISCLQKINHCLGQDPEKITSVEEVIAEFNCALESKECATKGVTPEGKGGSHKKAKRKKRTTSKKRKRPKKNRKTRPLHF
jgi:hypothetical protein